MTRVLKSFIYGTLAFSLGMVPSHAFLGAIKKRSEEKKVLNSDALTTQEQSARAQLDKAQSQENSGKTRQARDLYKAVTHGYPRTVAASEAQYHYARMLDLEKDDKKAFEAYQELVTNYRNAPNFNDAIKRLFEIAEKLRATEKKGFLGVGAPIQPSKLIEMFEFISSSAPFTEYAPKSLLNIGYIQTKLGETELAITMFKSVVDRYPGTEFAKEAQYQIFKLQGVTAEKSNSPIKDRAQVEAGLDFVNQNPEDQRATEIKSNLQVIEERSMEKLYNTGVFYEKSGKPDSARVYFREVVKNPSTIWAAKSQERLNALDNMPVSVEKKSGFFGANPLKKEKVEMRISEDEVVPLPVAEVAQ